MTDDTPVGDALVAKQHLTHRVATRDGLVDLPVPQFGGEPLVLPNVAAVVYRDDKRSALLLQTRVKDDGMYGRLEIPSGKWRAGESLEQAVRREVAEETGLELATLDLEVEVTSADPDQPYETSRGAVVAIGVATAYPALLIASECIAVPGEPSAERGETDSPRFVDVAVVKAMIEADPAQFSGPTLAVLCAVLG